MVALRVSSLHVASQAGLNCYAQRLVLQYPPWGDCLCCVVHCSVASSGAARGRWELLKLWTSHLPSQRRQRSHFAPPQWPILLQKLQGLVRKICLLPCGPRLCLPDIRHTAEPSAYASTISIEAWHTSACLPAH